MGEIKSNLTTKKLAFKFINDGKYKRKGIHRRVLLNGNLVTAGTLTSIQEDENMNARVTSKRQLKIQDCNPILFFLAFHLKNMHNSVCIVKISLYYCSRQKRC